MITGYGERVKPYLAATLTAAGCVVHEGPAPKTAEPNWETPDVRLEMLPDTYDADNWTTCHARITAVLECGDKELALERANNLLALVARSIYFNTEYGLPSLGGFKPFWLPGATVRSARPPTETMDPHNITLVWECDFPTACGGI